MVAPVPAARRLAVRAGLALVVANARYWTSVAPRVRRELRRWRRQAEAIDDPRLRALALSKLCDEGFHAEAAAMLATLAPRARRSSVVEAIVALELLFDYLDGLSERPCADPLGDGERLFRPLIDAVANGPDRTGESFGARQDDDGGYPETLSRAVALAIARLPAAGAIAGVAQRTAARSGQAQTRIHAAAQIGTGQLEAWANAQADGSELDWRELVAGAASSVLVLHALIAAAADPRTSTEAAARIAEGYMSTCALLTLLDGVIDYEHDTSRDASNQPGYLSLYEQPGELADTMAVLARRAIGQARALPDGARHVMLLTGVVAYYSSAPGCESELARPVIDRVRRELGPLIYATLAVMRAWRGARRRGPRGVAGALRRELRFKRRRERWRQPHREGPHEV
jgi:tetraprenyl-beta-curcumene synthase